MNITDHLVSLVFGVLQGTIVGIIVGTILKEAYREAMSIGINLSDYGIKKVSVAENGKLDQKSRNALFGTGLGLRPVKKPDRIRLCFISGYNFINYFEKEIVDLITYGTKIELLIAGPSPTEEEKLFDFNVVAEDNVFVETQQNKYIQMYKDDEGASFGDRIFLMLSSGKDSKKGDNTVENRICQLVYDNRKKGDCRMEIINTVKIVEELRKNTNTDNIRIRFYKDEYRMPIILANYDGNDVASKKPEVTARLWTNIGMPIREAMDTVSIYAEKLNDTRNKIVDDSELYFSYLWDKYESTEM